jgi:diguanylate cyclase (GGDEF)-like protein
VEKLNIRHEFSKVADHVTISLGVATVRPNPRIRLQDLIGLADKALYQAKQDGRNRHVQSRCGEDELAILHAKSTSRSG